MDYDRLKDFLQTYLNTVVSPAVNKKREQMGFESIEFSVYKILKGSYQPPIIHVFLHTEPEIKKSQSLKAHAVMMMSKVEKDIDSFFKVFSLNFKIKVHWNQMPIFKNDTIYTTD
jgi:hypothetical protein